MQKVIFNNRFAIYRTTIFGYYAEVWTVAWEKSFHRLCYIIVHYHAYSQCYLFIYTVFFMQNGQSGSEGGKNQLLMIGRVHRECVCVCVCVGNTDILTSPLLHPMTGSGFFLGGCKGGISPPPPENGLAPPEIALDQ